MKHSVSITSKHLLNEQVTGCGLFRRWFISVDHILTPNFLSCVLHEILFLIHIFYPKLHNSLGAAWIFQVQEAWCWSRSPYFHYSANYVFCFTV